MLGFRALWISDAQPLHTILKQSFPPLQALFTFTSLHQYSLWCTNILILNNIQFFQVFFLCCTPEIHLYYGHHNFHSTLVGKITLPPLNCIGIPTGNQLTKNVKFCFWNLNLILMLFTSLDRCQCHTVLNTVAFHNVWNQDMSDSWVLLQGCFSYSWSSVFPYEL